MIDQTTRLHSADELLAERLDQLIYVAFPIEVIDIDYRTATKHERVACKFCGATHAYYRRMDNDIPHGEINHVLGCPFSQLVSVVRVIQIQLAASDG